MRQGDVRFIVGSGDYKGKEYNFTLAQKSGVKQWTVTPLYEPPPSIIKEKIEMVLQAQEGNIPSNGAIELAAVNKILEQLRYLALESTITLGGFDQQERPVLVDESGFSVGCTTNETNREPEYSVNLTVWGLYQ